MMITSPKKGNAEKRAKNVKQKMMKNVAGKRRSAGRMTVGTIAILLKTQKKIATIPITVRHVAAGVVGKKRRKKKRKNLHQVLKQTHRQLKKSVQPLT